MDQNRIITEFIRRNAPKPAMGTPSMARHTLTTLSRYLCIEPDEVIAMAEAGLLQACEAYPGAPALTFSTYHLGGLRQEICLSHAHDTVELAQTQDEYTLMRVLEHSWQRRGEKVIELTAKR